MISTSVLLAGPVNAATSEVSTFAQLKAAVVTNAVDGDLIKLTSDIIATERLTISKAITIDGQGFSLSVTTPGVSESGLNESAPTAHGLFTVTSSNMVEIKNLSMMGGNTTNGAIGVSAGAKLKLNTVKLERSRSSTSGGGAVYNSGTLTIENSYLRRNSARYGGGVYNTGTLIMIGSSLVENRTEDANGGGGGVENSGTMWLSNSTFANNLTTAGGGAINNYQGTLYVGHSTFVGNVSTGPYDGGAILTFSGAANAKIASSLFAYNYSRTSGNVFVLDDFKNSQASTPLAVAGSTTISNSIVQTADSWDAAFQDSYVTDYSASIDGSGDTLFSGGTYAYPTNGVGAEVTTYGKVFRPNLLIQNGKPTAALITPNSTPGLTGAPVAFTPTTVFGVLANGSTWTSYVGSANSQNVTTDQIGSSRSSSTPTVGALEGGVAQTYLVSSPTVSGGTVSGASLYGDVYNANANATITAVPATGKTFSTWSISVNGGTATSSTSNPLTFTVTGNTTVTPTFVNAATGTRTVTYTATGSDSGTPPSAVTSSSDIIISSTAGSMIKSGYVLSGWNTAANGTGTSYALGATYLSSSSSNLTLYPVWTVQTVFSITYDANGADSGSIPSATSGSGSVSISGNTNSLGKSGFTFAGWNTLANGSGTNYSAGSSYNLVADVTLYAKWEAVAQQVTPPASSSGTSPSPSDPPAAVIATTSPSSTTTFRAIPTAPVSSEIPTVNESPSQTPTPSPTDTITLTQSGDSKVSQSNTVRFVVLLGLLLLILLVVFLTRKPSK